MTRQQRGRLAIAVTVYLLLATFLGLGYAMGITGLTQRWMEAFAVVGLIVTAAAVGFLVVLLLAVMFLMTFRWVDRGKE